MIRPQLAGIHAPHGSKISQPSFLSAREATRSNDTQYRFRQDSDFLYLTGFEEPESIAVLAPGGEQKYTLVCAPARSGTGDLGGPARRS